MEVKFLNLQKVHSGYETELRDAVLGALNSNHYILGPNLSLFEEEFSKFCTVKYSVGVGNGLEALIIALKALDIGNGAEVIVPSNTFIATALAVSAVGAQPVLVDPDPKTFNITAEGVAEKITAKTRAIIPVHLFGQACEMGPILKLAEASNIFVIEDNAQAQGATFGGQITGSFGVLGATSFYPGKNLGACGDAGAITTSNEDLFTKVCKIRNYGSSVKYNHEVIGVNSRLDELQSAFLRVKLRYLSMQNQERQRIAAKYNQLLAGISGVETPFVAENCSHVYHLYVVKAKNRNGLQTYLAENRVDTLIHYPIPIARQKAYKNIFPNQPPIADKLASEILSLPIYPGLGDEEIEYVCDLIKAFYEKL